MEQTPINTTGDRWIRVSRCCVLWSLKNIRYSVNDSIVVDSNVKQIPEGYYTFQDIKDYLKSEYNIVLEKLRSNKITLESPKDLDLKSFGYLLGFDRDKKITRGTKYTSLYSARMTNDLKEIFVYCSTLIDQHRNYSYNSRGQYIPSSLLVDLNIDTSQSLNGSITNYDLDYVRCPLKDYRGQDIEFVVESGGHVFDYEIIMTLEIE